VVERQRKTDTHVISDGELGKVGFSKYVLQRMSGFEGHADFTAADFADAPGVVQDVFGSEGSKHLCHPDAAWLKLRARRQLASQRLW
jgi:5-methyltetrahydropteroyltriglutamate--homocysteine methyltransferase